MGGKNSQRENLHLASGPKLMLAVRLRLSPCFSLRQSLQVTESEEGPS